MSLDVLGAGEGLGTKYITLRVKGVDMDKLRQKFGGYANVLTLVDMAPEVALRTALPVAAKKAATDYGVELDWQVTDAPPQPGVAPPSNFGTGVLSGGAMMAALWAAWKFLF